MQRIFIEFGLNSISDIVLFLKDISNSSVGGLRSWGEWPFVFVELGRSSNYFQGAG